MSYKLIINEYPLMLLPSLAVAIGLNEALVLQQVHYWLDPRLNKNYHNNRYWVYNSYQKWQEQFPFWAERTLRRAINSLEIKELLIYDFFNKTTFDKTKWYTINYDAVATLETRKIPSGQIGQIDMVDTTASTRTSRTEDLDKMACSINKYTETTTKTITETNISDSMFIKKMIDLWNESLPTNHVTLTKTREANLLKIFHTCFTKNMASWKEFLSIITASDFLMGKITAFKVNFDWAIKEDHIHRILEGAYSNNGTKPYQSETTKQDLEQEAEAFISNIDDKTWHRICSKINEKYGSGIVLSWFRDLEWIGLQDNTFVIRAATAFKRDWVSTYYLKLMKETLANFTEEDDPKLRILHK